MDLEPHFEHYLDPANYPIKYVVDIGAQDGPGPVYSLMKDQGYDGLCIEGSPENYGYLCANLPQSNVAKHCEFVTPHNICSIFEKYHVPKELFALKIDIDGYDYEVLDMLLSKYNPIFVVAEINEKIPPPILFQTKYHSNYVWGRNHFFGFSLQSAYTLMGKHGYTIIRLVGGNNILCIRNDIHPQTPQISATEIYKRDYLHNLPVLWMFPWNRDIHHWTQICDDINKIDETINDMIDYFTSNRIQRGEGIGTPVSRDAFFIGKM
jgi:hypothetical protein